ncbi:hypothetical protein L3X38_025599 [Prunus dulcis]|uniref:O-fucosyltransferase family protein n=1 Tax=Prunus dulcis TaxID=3755 RepID=A0AAD4Z7H8_PRUDU|nr:hypothetical protein L3X38_025599 [Prunus dulcis]
MLKVGWRMHNFYLVLFFLQQIKKKARRFLLHTPSPSFITPKRQRITTHSHGAVLKLQTISSLLPPPPPPPSSSISASAAADVKTYLLTAISGGLNQQRRGITDAFIAAYILNATLLVLKLGQKLFWKDSSNFDEIFDVDWFISSLSKDVEIIKQLPTKGGIPMSPYSMPVLNKNIVSVFQENLPHLCLSLSILAIFLGVTKQLSESETTLNKALEVAKRIVVPGGGKLYMQATLTRYEVNINHSQGKVLPSVRVSDPGLLLKPDEPNLIIMAKPAGGPSERDQHAGMDED